MSVILVLNLLEVATLLVIAGAIAYTAGELHVLRRLVSSDAAAALKYRGDVLKLQAGTFRRSGRGAVFARRNGKHADAGDERDGEDLSHDLMMRAGADA